MSDDDGSGSISIDELKKLFAFLEIAATDEEIQKIVRLVDVDRSGTLDFEEFVTLIHLLLNPGNDEDGDDEDETPQLTPAPSQETDPHRANLRQVFNNVGKE